MKRRHLVTALLVMLIIAALTGFTPAAAQQEPAEEVQIINQLVTIDPYEVIQPATVNSKPGTTVVWINASQFPVEILFLDKKVALACGSPANFSLGKGGAYESAQLSRGGTASLCFTQKGKYEYVVRSSRTLLLQYGGTKERKETRGTIVIQ